MNAVRMTARILSTVKCEMDLIGRYDSHGLCLLMPRATAGARHDHRAQRFVSVYPKRNGPGCRHFFRTEFGFSGGVAEVSEGDDPVRLFQRGRGCVGGDWWAIDSPKLSNCVRGTASWTESDIALNTFPPDCNHGEL